MHAIPRISGRGCTPPANQESAPPSTPRRSSNDGRPGSGPLHGPINDRRQHRLPRCRISHHPPRTSDHPPKKEISMEDTPRRLMWHGMFLFLLGLLTGFLEPHFINMRMGLAAHLEGVMNG